LQLITIFDKVNHFSGTRYLLRVKTIQIANNK